MRRILSLLLLISFNAYSYPLGVQGQSGSVKYPAIVKAPYNQATVEAGGGNVLIESGNENMFINPSFEGGVTAGWSCIGSTCASTGTASEISSGKYAIKIAPSAGIFSLSQSAATPTGIQKQGVTGILYKIPSTCSTATVSSLVDGVAQTVVPSSSLIFDNLYHSIEVPLTFGATSAGIQIQATSGCTGNVIFDAAYVKQGLGTQNLMLDNVYSAQVTTTSGTIANQNKSFIASCTAANPTVCTFNSGIFTVAPTCSASPSVAGNGLGVGITAVTSSGFTAKSFITSTVADSASQIVVIVCQKSGNDYLASSANVYSSTNGNTSWTPCTFSTLAWQGLGTITNNSLQCQRNGSNLEIKGVFTAGTPNASIVQIPLPSNYGTILTSSTGSISDSYGFLTRLIAATGTLYSTIATTGQNYFNVSGILVSVATDPSVAVGGTTIAGAPGNIFSFSKISIPISGWSNSNVIVGSFGGYTAVPGYQGNVDTFSVSFGTTNVSTVCSTSPCFIDQIGSAVASITRSSVGAYVLNTSKTYSKLKCVSAVNTNTTVNLLQATMTCASCSSLSFSYVNPTIAYIDSFGTLLCQGSY